MKKLIILIFSTCLLLYGESIEKYNREIENKTKEIKNLDREISKTKKSKKIYEEKLKTVKIEMKNLERKQKQLNKHIKTISKKIDISKKKMETIASERKECVTMKEIARGDLSSLINKFYRAHITPPPLFQNYINKEIFLSLMESKRVEVRNLVMKDIYLEKIYKNYSSEYTDLMNQKLQTKSEKDKCEKELQNKKQILDSAEKKLASLSQEIKKLEATAKELNKLVNQLRAKRKSLVRQKAKEDLAKYDIKKEDLIWPVNGTIITHFGRHPHPELKTYIISNGIKIKTSHNTDVKSVTKGTVVFVGDFHSYGKTVIIDHDNDFFTIYSNLKEVYIKEGRNVEKGEKIANVNEGILYFELRLGGRAVDPLLFLKNQQEIDSSIAITPTQ